MAGSSIPLTVRTPECDTLRRRDGSAVMLGYGDLDAYGFHTLESLQCMVEQRKDGETGIRSVEWLNGIKSGNGATVWAAGHSAA